MFKFEVRSPTRVDLAGGTLDLWPLYNFIQGATTINVAIDIYTLARLEENNSTEIVLESRDLKLKKNFKDLNAFLADQDPQWKLIKTLVQYWKPNKGFYLYTQSDSPVGGGLGGSSSLTISLIKAFAQWANRRFDSAHEVVRLAHNLEAYVLNTPTGTQDYYPALTGGLNVLQYSFNGIEHGHLSLAQSPIKENFMLAYTGKSHHSGLNNFEVMKSAVGQDVKTIQSLQDLAQISSEMLEVIKLKKWGLMSSLFEREYRARIGLAKAFTSPEIEKLNDISIKNGASAVKICGAGGGGCVMIWCEPAKQQGVKQECEKAGFQILNARPVEVIPEFQ